jgi:hypothetical protein
MRKCLGRPGVIVDGGSALGDAGRCGRRGTGGPGAGEAGGRRGEAAVAVAPEGPGVPAGGRGRWQMTPIRPQEP